MACFACLLAQTADAAQYCGRVWNDGYGYPVFITQGQFDVTTTSWLCYIGGTNTRYRIIGDAPYLCLNYSTQTTNIITGPILTNCTIVESSRKCNTGYKVAPPDGEHDYGRCVSCSYGSYASEGGSTTLHSNTSCDYCYSGYYYSNGNCIECPDRVGTNYVYTRTAGSSYKPSITSCYVPEERTMDATGGRYKFTSDCYYKL